MRIVDTAGMREAEAAAVSAGTGEYTLMRRAGDAAARFISALMTKHGFSRVVFLCGGGNNAGDALVAAAGLHDAFRTELWAIRPLSALRGAAALAAESLPDELKSDVALYPAMPTLMPGDLVVDGLLGIGLKGEVRSDAAGVIAAVNASGLPVLALDVPSGMDSDTGVGKCPGKEAMHARWTMTFGLPKAGLFSPAGIGFSGALHTADIGLAKSAPPSSVDAFTAVDACELLPRYAADVHKNRRGRLAVMAGSRRYPGAAALAARAGLRGGAGLVTAFYPSGAGIRFPDAVIPSELPAGPAGGFAAAPDMRHLSFDALAAGPGWGDDVPCDVLRNLVRFSGKLLLDADAINLLSRNPDVWRHRSDTVITPHPGEAERLRQAFGLPEGLFRVMLASELAKRTGATVVLKGARTAVASPDGLCSLNTSGGPDLATAGSGDVLSGIIGALLAGGMAVFDAARLGVFIHGAAGERCGRGCIADDLPAASSAIMAELENRTFL